jgi:hypothetical protein
VWPDQNINHSRGRGKEGSEWGGTTRMEDIEKSKKRIQRSKKR